MMRPDQLLLDLPLRRRDPELVIVTMDPDGHPSQYRAEISPWCGKTEADGPGLYWSSPPSTDRRVWHCGLHGFEDRPL